MFKVIAVNGKEILVDADDFLANKDRVVFTKDSNNVAWFLSANVVGFKHVEEQEHE